jgi:nitrogenase-stabilizing/protective protein
VSVLDDLGKLSAAEDFFSYLGVPYDQKVLNVARLHILRRMADRLAEDARDRAGSSDRADDAAAWSRYRAHLEAAYADFAARSPLDERVFKVLKDAVGGKSGGGGAGFVPLSALVPGEPQKKGE